MKVEYSWLTGAMQARDDFLGSGYGMPLPFLLRHGISTSKNGRWNPVFTLAEEAECVKRGDFHFYLASVDSDDIPLDMTMALFMPDTLLLSGVLIVGVKLMQKLREQCSLESGSVILLDSKWVSAHAWKYRLPPSPKSDELFMQLYKSLDVDELPGEIDIMRWLAERYPAPTELPDMYLILCPWLKLTRIQKAWKQDIIVISMADGGSVVTRNGNIKLSPEYLASQPIIKCEGFLIPPAVAALFETDEDKRSWPVLTCKKKVVIEA